TAAASTTQRSGTATRRYAPRDVTRTPAFRLRIAATIASATRPAISTGPTSRPPDGSPSVITDLDLHVVADDPHRVRPQCHAGRVQTAARAGVVLPFVSAAGQRRAGEAPPAQGKRLVAAAVFEGPDLSVDVQQQERPAVDAHAHHLPGPQL